MEKNVILEEEKNNLIYSLNLLTEKIKSVSSLLLEINSSFNNENTDYFQLMKELNLNDLDIVGYQQMNLMQNKLSDDVSQIEYLNKELKSYKKMQDNPYFARIDIKADDQNFIEKYYIGIHSLIDNNSYKIIDWRSPIASVYYDYECGKAIINTPNTSLKCELLNKRQFKIENGELKYYFDSNVTIDDEILMQTLALNKDNKMKSIVETIQKEQNKIIRSNDCQNLIVQGVAGSGKTAIALHRVAYLLYSLRGKVDGKEILFLSPNASFSSYISNTLPDIAEEDIEKIQLDDIAKNILQRFAIVEPKSEMIERVINNVEDYNRYQKFTSIQTFNILCNFCEKEIKNSFKASDFTIVDKTISGEFVNNLYYNKYSNETIFNALKYITENVFDYYFYKTKSANKLKNYKENIFQVLYSFIPLKHCVKLYFKFLEQNNLKYKLIDKKLSNEDVYNLMYIRLFLFGENKYLKIKHLIIDELQDYTPVQVAIIKMLFKCTITGLGDINQSLFGVKYLPTFDNCAKIELFKSYRSTRQIANFYKNLIGLNNLKMVNRNGNNVELKPISELKFVIENYKARGYKSIAIITKTDAQAKKLYNEIENQIEVEYVGNNNLTNKIHIISIYNSKGLEFDGVVLYDVSQANYSINELSLLFVGSSRALHGLTLLSDNLPNKIVLKSLQEKI